MNQPSLDIATPLTIPAWVPPGYADRLAGRAVAVEVPAAVRRRLRTPEKMKVSDWAEQHRQVVEGAHVGDWDHAFAPHTVKIMDTFGQPWVREVWFCGVEQSGKTNTMINCLCWAIDCDPGNIFYLMPTIDDSAKIVGSKLRPTLQQTERLRKYLSKKQDDTTLKSIQLTHGMTILPAHANSPSSMATYAAKHCFGDEVDKYPELAGREADPITLIKKRNRTYKGRFKRFFSSTPGGRFIVKGLKNCHQQWAYRVRCPDCGELIRMDADHLVLPVDATAHNVDRFAVQYACNDCGSVWDDTTRETAIRAGRWVCTHGDDVPRPATVGFHHRSWECLDIPLAEIAKAYLLAQDGDLAAKIAWANGYEAEDYEPPKVSKKADDILALCDDRPRDLVPTGAASLALQVDTQQDGFYYTLRAVGYCATPTSSPKSWLVSKGYLLSFSDLETLAAGVWRDSTAKEYRIISALIDSGGTKKAGAPQKHSRTKEVYEFCKRNPLFKPIKGTGRKEVPFKYTNLDRWPGTQKAIPGGLVLVTIDVHYYKDELARCLSVAADDPGAFLLYSGFTEQQLEHPVPGITPDSELKDYARHLTAEYRDELGNWQHDTKVGRNDFADCETYFMYHIDLLKSWGVLVGASDHQAPRRRVYSEGVVQR